jgi:hypothetical protein
MALDTVSDVGSKGMKEVADFVSVGGNVGVCVGVRGDESWAEAGDESVSTTGRASCGSFFGVTDVTVDAPESTRSVSVTDSTVGLFVAGIAVLALDFCDLTDSFEPSFSFDRLMDDDLELGLDSDSSCTFAIRDGVLFCCCENSVSGGLGGRAFTGRVKSADADLFLSSAPISVDSGV